MIKIDTAESLAVELSKRTRSLRDAIKLQLAQKKEAPEMLTSFYEAFQTYLIGTLTPEAIFYAVLYSPIYRKKFAEFLKSNFPFTADYKLFKQLAMFGEQLVSLHLLKSSEIEPPACRFEGKGDNRIGKERKTGLRYVADEERVYINATQYFAPVPEAVWTYQIDGYQVCEKWLKDPFPILFYDTHGVKRYKIAVSQLAGFKNSLELVSAKGCNGFETNIANQIDYGS